jgi:trigger factor
MADETNPAETTENVEAPVDNLPPNTVTIEDAGDATKKITIEVSRERIDAKYNEIFGELRTSAQVPGFRMGHAPRRLLEKRFSKEVGQDVRNAVVSEALGKAVEANDLKILGEPDIKMDELVLPESGNFTFSITVEVKPEFDLPEYAGIEVSKPAAEVTDERIDQALKMFLSHRGTVAPTTEGAEEDDTIVADVKLTGEGIGTRKIEAQELQVGPAALEGIPLENLGEKLAGAKAGETVTVEATVPETHAEEAWRGKTAKFELAIQEVKRMEVPELTDELAGDFGFENVAGFRDYVRGSLEQRMAAESQQTMRDQVCKYLLDNTKVELPAGVAARNTVNALRRRYVDLLQRGVPREQIDQNLELLQAQAGEQAQVELKLSFVLEKIAEKEEITVEEGEINSRIAQMAAQYGRRPERLRSEMTSEGTLDQVGVQIREQKALDKLLEMAKVTDAAPEAAEEAGKAKKPKKAAAKSKKKTDEGEKKE